MPAGSRLDGTAVWDNSADNAVFVRLGRLAVSPELDHHQTMPAAQRQLSS